MPLLYHNNNSISNITSFAQVPSGSLTLLSTATASASSSISFTSGIDSTYDIYQFEFINCHPSTNSAIFQFNMSTDGGSNYNVTKTSTSFFAYHNEADNDTALGYNTDGDLAQSTAYQTLVNGIGSGADESSSGTLLLFNPASTTYVKHYLSNLNRYSGITYSVNDISAGYGNTTSAVNAIRFQMSSGNIDAGTIKLYGIKGN
jgi:hypothetical protein